MIAIDMSKFGGKSALDVMNEEDADNAQLFAKLPQLIDGLGPNLPPELINKTVKKIKELGINDVSSFGFDPRTRAMTEHNSYDQTIDFKDSRESEQSRRLLHALENDDGYLVDELMSNDHPFEDATTRNRH